MREPDVDRERDAAPAAPAQLTVMSSGSAARPGPEGPSGIVRVEPETRSEGVGVFGLGLPNFRVRAPGIPTFWARNPGSRDRGSGNETPDLRLGRTGNHGCGEGPQAESPGRKRGHGDRGSDTGSRPRSLLRPLSLLPRVLPTNEPAIGFLPGRHRQPRPTQGELARRTGERYGRTAVA